MGYNRPPARLDSRETRNVSTVRDEADWPIPAAEYRRLSLDMTGGGLVTELSAAKAQITYDALDKPARFTLRFDRDTELSGNMKLRLRVSADWARDMRLGAGHGFVHWHRQAGCQRCALTLLCQNRVYGGAGGHGVATRIAARSESRTVNAATAPSGTS